MQPRIPQPSLGGCTVLRDVPAGFVDMYHVDDSDHGPLARYVKLWVAHVPGIPGTFSLPMRVSNPDMHHGTCVTRVL